MPYRVAAIVVLLVWISGAGDIAGQALSTERSRREALQRYREGQSLLTAERWEKAVDAFRAAIRHEALFADAHYGLGMAYMGLRRFTSAAQAFEACIDAARQLHRLRERDRVLERVSSSVNEPFVVPAHVLLALGSAHFRNGDRSRAEHYWTEAVEVNSSLGEAWNNLAAIYATGGRRRDAERAVANAERAGFRVNPRLKEEITRIP